MSVESAEMVKHSLNAFLALSITFTNELATIAERVGADASDIEKALRSDPRIGPYAYVKAGSALPAVRWRATSSFFRRLPNTRSCKRH